MKAKLRRVKPGIFSVEINDKGRIRLPGLSSQLSRKKGARWARSGTSVAMKEIRPGLLEVHLDNEDTKACGKTKS